ncbi:FAD/NAD(P)-binding domain-containing protein [Aspergillus candidus]|uniref:FAD/NAD(P)-binding domain-containing protein n=1 Tax=Aspergillus candidus TaxID=41067 RepID=A0A2I2EY16_ASPCN|nr:FAD/NAD(P)-binding domain-containing protein [Aspergillus candidus]PLB33268.1 FAD/NAD(P)-binding domain-containing protein [Aspergillus candidus]
MSPNRDQPGIPLKITVIGAGIAGLSSAIALADSNLNHQITVLESNTSLSEFGAGLQLFPNSTRILNKWGLTTSLEKVAVQSSHMSFRRWEDNTELAINMNNPTNTWLYGCPQWQIYRPDLQQVLFERLKQQSNVTVLFGESVVSVDHETGTVNTSNGNNFEANLAVAADGIWSRSRRCLPASKDILPTPYKEHHYRAVIPRSRMISNPVTAGFMSSRETKAWVGPGVFVLGYTVASNELYNVVIGVPRPSQRAPLGRWNHTADVEAMRGLVSGWCEEVRALVSLVHKGECVSWTLGEVGPIPSYVSTSGRLALIGDAAHALLPHAAQGAGMALEDAASLAEFLGHLTSTEDVASMMGAWSGFRQARVEHLRSISRGTAVDMTLPDGELQIARDVKWSAIRDHQRAQLAELGIEKVREKVLRNRPAPDPACKSTVEPGGRMWVHGFDVSEESKKFCLERLGVGV